MPWTHSFQYGGVQVRWDPASKLLHMAQGPDPLLSDHTAWNLGKQMGEWIRGMEGQVGALVDARGVAELPDDWRDYWIKVLHKGFVKGFAVHGATPAFARTAAAVAKLTGVPHFEGQDEAECILFLASLPPLPRRAPSPGATATL